jgi:hypothetical protein
MPEEYTDLVMEYRDPAYGALVQVYVDHSHDAHSELGDIYNDGYSAAECDEFEGEADRENRQIKQGEKFALSFYVETLGGGRPQHVDGVVVDHLDFETIVYEVRSWFHLGIVAIPMSEWVGDSSTDVQHSIGSTV